MRVICDDQVAAMVPESVLSRSALLADIHQSDQEGRARLPCDSKTWTTWLTDDPSQITAATLELGVAVIRVRILYCQEPCLL
jgi:hypothetical protein